MGSLDHTGKLGAGGNFHQQVTRWTPAQQWPTPDASVANDGEGLSTWLARRERVKATAKNGNGMGTPLTIAVQMHCTHWPTPRAEEREQHNSQDAGMALSAMARQWPTPRATDGTEGGPNQTGSRADLTCSSAAAQWPTPASRDYRTPNSQTLLERGGGGKGEQLPNFVEHHFSHPVLSTLDGRPLSPTARTLPRRLNPAFACWLMGWPIWWTNPALTSCAKSAMASYRYKLQWHLSSLCGEPGSAE